MHESDAAGPPAAEIEMPRYESHKKVWALEIALVTGHRLDFAEKGYAPTLADAEMFSRYTPVAGDFYVQYADGYKSFSPRKAFLEGYKAEHRHTAERIVQIAQTCHEANRAYCASLGDLSQPAWADAPDWQKQSAVTGVQFTLANPDATPSASHESWLEEKRRDGWVYGAVKNAETKEHPCFVPYDELPREQRAKDYIFQAIVRSLA